MAPQSPSDRELSLLWFLSKSKLATSFLRWEVTLPKKRRKGYTSYSFIIARVFPAADPIAIDLLRLMAGYNDLLFVMEWFEAHRRAAVNENARKIATGRVSL